MPRKLISEPIIFVAEIDREDIIIQLQEGIPVHGTAMFDDGLPAAGETIAGVRPMIPPVWAESKNDMILNQHIQPNFALEFQTPVQDDGAFELYLPPGEFLIQKTGGDRPSESVVLKDSRKENRVALTFPAPLRGKFVKENGSDFGISPEQRIHVAYASKDEGTTSCHSLDNFARNEFSFEKKKGSFLIAMMEDGSLGAIHPIPDDQLGELQTVVLKPAATIKLKLTDATESPVAGREIHIETGAITKGSSSTTSSLIPSAITDAKGFATFKVPPGMGYYRFAWEGGTMECERTLPSGETIHFATR